MKIFTGNSNPLLAQRITACLNTLLGDAEISRFPDGEISVKIKENIRGRDIFVVQSICQPPNENLMELLIMIDAMRRASAARVTAVLPFYGYARQDRKDQPRVPITAKLVANLLVAAGANRILTMDLHSQQIQGFFDIPVDHLYALPAIAKYLMEKNLGNVVVVSPDTGGMKMAYAYSQMLRSKLAVVAKQRLSPTSVETLTLVGDVKGCTAVIVDDLVTTGSTLCEATKLLLKNGAVQVLAAVTHAVLTRTGIENIKQSQIKELIVTDTVPIVKSDNFPVIILSVADLLGEAILRIHENRSVSSLFQISR